MTGFLDEDCLKFKIPRSVTHIQCALRVIINTRVIKFYPEFDSIYTKGGFWVGILGFTPQ